jgi:hypothetical protein
VCEGTVWVFLCGYRVYGGVCVWGTVFVAGTVCTEEYVCVGTVYGTVFFGGVRCVRSGTYGGGPVWGTVFVGVRFMVGYVEINIKCCICLSPPNSTTCSL